MYTGKEQEPAIPLKNLILGITILVVNESILITSRDTNSNPICTVSAFLEIPIFQAGQWQTFF